MPFDSINLVKFEVVPDEVCSFVAGFQTTSNDSPIWIEVAPAMGARGPFIPASRAQRYTNLYGTRKTFANTGDLNLTMETAARVAVQFTLFLHKIPSLSETPSNGLFTMGGAFIDEGLSFESLPEQPKVRQLDYQRRSRFGRNRRLCRHIVLWINVTINKHVGKLHLLKSLPTSS